MCPHTTIQGDVDLCFEALTILPPPAFKVILDYGPTFASESVAFIFLHSLPFCNSTNWYQTAFPIIATAEQVRPEMTRAADFLGGKRCLICRTWLPKDHFPQVTGVDTCWKHHKDEWKLDNGCGVYAFVKHFHGTSGDTDHQATSGEAPTHIARVS